MSLIKEFKEIKVNSSNPFRFGVIQNAKGIFSDSLTTSLSEFDKHKSNRILATDLVYFTKTSNFPKYKVKANSFPIKKTNRINYANTYVVNYNFIKKLYENDYFDLYCKISREDILNIGRSGGNNPILSEDYYFFKCWEEPEFDLSKYPIVKIKKINGWGSNKEIYFLDVYEKMVSKLSTHKIVFDETLINLFNDGSEISNEMYYTLINMLEGNDEGNKNIAMDFICNCDFQKSKCYILILLNEFRRELPEKTPNYQSMISYFADYKYVIRENWDIFVKILIDSGLDGNDYNIINAYIIRRLNKNLEFKIKSLDLYD